MGSDGLVGRRTELDTIGRALDDARAGRSRVLSVRGPAGVGKSALLDGAADGAAGFRVLRAAGVEAEAELPFAGLHQLLRPLAPVVAALPEAQRDALEAALGVGAGRGDRFLTAAATLQLLAEAGEEQPLLCAIDDLQWVDGPSADALFFAARRLDAEPVAMLFALRDTEPFPPGLRQFPALELGGLERADARKLLERRGRLAPDDRERLLDAAGGVPLALLELPHGPIGAVAPVPDAMGPVERAFADRIAALPGRARRALLLATADDDPHGRTALVALADAGLAPADMGAAEAAGLVRIAAGRIAFRHPLVRSAAYGTATFEDRRAAHAALAGALAQPADADRRAWHRAAAAPAPDAGIAAELAEAGARARDRGGHAAAAAAFERAARLTPDDAPRARRLVQAAHSARLAGDLERAVALAAAGASLAADAPTAAEAGVIRGAVAAHRGHPEDACDDLARAARAMAELQPRRAVRMALLASEAAALAGDHERTGELARWTAALPAGDADADRALVAFAGGMARLFAGDAAAACDRFLRAAALAERSGDAEVLFWTAAGTLYGGDVAGARRGFARAVARAREGGAIGVVAFALPALANTEALEGRFTACRTDAAEGLDLAREVGDEGAAAHARAVLAWHAATRGWEEDCRALAGEALAWTGATTARPSAESAQHALALLDLGLGRPDAALDRLTAVLEDPGAHPARRLLVAGDLVEAAAGCGREDVARGALGDLAAYARGTGSAWAAATIAGAEVHLAGGPDAAEAAFVHAVEVHRPIELPFDLARLELRVGEQLRRARRRTDARRYLRSAVDAFARLGATPWERRAANELRATGETARRRDADTLDELTAQEAQVARLVAEGATNREIASRLFLSPRTVEYHLRKVFRKLGVTSRTQLAGLDW